jgi:Protein of unknown function (DUF3618)
MNTHSSTDPGTKSPEEVQREVRESRGEVEETLEAIEERLSPGKLFDQAVDYMRSSGGTDFLRNLGTRVRDNPIPVALVGTGLAWLMLSGTQSRRRYYDDELLDEYAGAGDYRSETWRDDEHRSGGRAFAERAKRTAEAARRKAERLRARGQRSAYGLYEPGQEMPHDRSERARETADDWSAGARARRFRASARHRLSETGEQLWRGARDAGDHASSYGRRVRRGFIDTLYEHPLVLGALGLGVGAAIGAALRATEKEDEWLGDTRDRLKDRAKEAGREQIDKARAAAGAASSAAREEAKRQGLTPEGGSAGVESAAKSDQRTGERVAEGATEAAKFEAERPRPGETGDT